MIKRHTLLIASLLLSVHCFSQFGKDRRIMDENGTVKQQFRSVPDGLHEVRSWYFPDGTVLTDTLLAQDLKDGVSTWRDRSGRLLREEHYVKGVANGYSHAWDTTGRLLYEAFYENGTITWQTGYNPKGKILYRFDKTIPGSREEAHYQRDQVTLDLKEFYRYVIIDGDTVIPRYAEEYDAEGRLESVSATIEENEEETIFLAYGTDNWLAGPDRMETRDVKVIFNRTNDYRNVVLMSPHQDLSIVVSVDTESPAEAIRRLIGKATKHAGQEAKEQGVFDEATFREVSAYNKSAAGKILFSSGKVTSSFDSSMTGAYRIDYEGTTMHFEGYLLEGWLHGKAVLYLNDTVKLFEKEFQFGLQHGRSREWHLNGNPALDQQFRKGKRYRETSYYLNGIKKEYLETIDSLYAMITDQWYPDGALKHFTVVEPGRRMRVSLDRTGKVMYYSVDDNTGDSYFSRCLCSDDDIEKKQDDCECRGNNYYDKYWEGVYPFTIKKYGVVIEGTFSRDRETNTAEVRDNLGPPYIYN